MIDTRLRKQVDRVNLGDDTFEFAVADGKWHIFVNSVHAAEVIVVDTAERRVTADHRLTNCVIPTGLAYVEKSWTLISASANGVVKFIRASDGVEISSIPIAKDADAVIYDPGRNLALIPSAENATLSVVAIGEGGQGHLVERVATQFGTRTGALDPKTGQLYLPTAKFGPKNKLGWPEALPGTVQLLVMAPAAN